MMHCLLTIAFVCFSNASSVEIGPGGLMQFAMVRAGPAEISIPIYTDSLLMRDRWRMARACGADACVAYYKVCKTVQGGTECSYALAGRPYANSLSIRAPDRAAIAEAERRIAIVGEGGTRWEIPLSRLSFESPDDPPTCRHEGRGPICFDAIVARLTRLAAFEIDGDDLSRVIAAGQELGWRVATARTPAPSAAGAGWTVYAPSPPLTVVRFYPPPQRRTGDVRAFLIAIEPLLPLGTSVKAIDSEGREIEP